MYTIAGAERGCGARIALGIVTYQALPSLTRLLAQIAASSAADVPLRVSDDGSTDGTAERIAAAGIGWSMPHLGVASNRNRVLADAMYRLHDGIVILDDDVEIAERDWWDHWTAYRPNADLVYCASGYRDYASGEPVPISAHACRISRRCCETIGYMDPAYDRGWGHEDEDYRDRAVRAGLTVAGYDYGIAGGGAGRHLYLAARADNGAYYAALPSRPIYCPLAGHGS